VINGESSGGSGAFGAFIGDEGRDALGVLEGECGDSISNAVCETIHQNWVYDATVAVFGPFFALAFTAEAEHSLVAGTRVAWRAWRRQSGLAAETSTKFVDCLLH
jgi:hypothetical protein